MYSEDSHDYEKFANTPIGDGVKLDFDSMGDKRYKNWLDALRLMILELKNEDISEVSNILTRFGVFIAYDKDNKIWRTNLEYPGDIERMQVFKKEDGTYEERFIGLNKL